MHVRVGDRLIVAGHHTGGPNRECRVLEVLGADGGPPYLIRWEDNGHEALFIPGSNVSLDRRDSCMRLTQ
jgi:hypothetical protein